MLDAEQGLRRILEVLTRLNIPYLIGGSLASSIHGIYRATADIDLVADIRPQHVRQFAAELEADFYADSEMMLDALRHGRSFNLIHYATSYKFDIFPLSSEPYYQSQFERRQTAPHSFGGVSMELTLPTPEDTLLTKLAWYRSGGETSERQWNDVRGIVEIQRGRLDLDYLRKWARHLRVEDLLEEALSATG